MFIIQLCQYSYHTYFNMSFISLKDSGIMITNLYITDRHRHDNSNFLLFDAFVTRDAFATVALLIRVFNSVAIHAFCVVCDRVGTSECSVRRRYTSFPRSLTCKICLRKWLCLLYYLDLTWPSCGIRMGKGVDWYRTHGTHSVMDGRV
jgi:hypothetical protein